MHKIYFVLIASLTFIFISASGGVGENQNKDRSGSPDGSNVCSQCHSSSSFSTQINLTVLDDDGAEVTSYVPEETYLLVYEVSSASGSPLEFGFQGTALFEDNENAGEFMNPGVQTQLETVSNTNISGREVVEHSSPSASGTWEVEWTAPSASSGEVTFYYSGVAANGNNMSSGDTYGGGELSLDENTISSIEEEIDSRIELLTDLQSVILTSQENMPIQSYEIYSVTGSLIEKSKNVTTRVELDRGTLTNGINIIVVSNGVQEQTFKVIN